MKKNRIVSVILVAILLFTSASITSFASGKKPSIRVPAEQNYAQAQEVLRLINKERTKRGLKKLSLDRSLCNAAILRAAEASIYVPATSPHRRPNGKLVKTANKRIVYECEAGGYTSAAEAVHGWMTSKPHKKGILLKKAKSVGIGCIKSAEGGYMWTLEFSNKKVKKKVKRFDTVSSVKTVKCKKKYVKPTYFTLEDGSTITLDEVRYPTDVLNRMTATNGCGIKLGKITPILPCYTSKWNFNMKTALVTSDFTWSSSNPSVVTVDASGNAHGIAEGEAVITATMKYAPGYSISRNVIVYMDDPSYYY